MAYAAPIDVANAPNGVTPSQLPSSVTDNLLSGLANFTVMLTTLACGRDLYSPLVTCADCQAAYRTWLCFVSLPRCAEDANATSSTSASSTVTPSPALQMQDAANPRSPYLPSFPQNYTAVLPCLEVCNAADRACPPFLGFQCPKPQYTAAMSYGVGYIDSGEEGEVGGGSTGSAVDRWGTYGVTLQVMFCEPPRSIVCLTRWCVSKRKSSQSSEPDPRMSTVSLRAIDVGRSEKGHWHCQVVSLFHLEKGVFWSISESTRKDHISVYLGLYNTLVNPEVCLM